MKLSKKDKQELRKSVEVLLNASPDNKKIQLSNETLDQLLFDTYVVNKEKGIKVKLPVWSGDFLRKLDLSRVSFEDVSWGMVGDKSDIEFYVEYPIDSDFYKQVEEGKIKFSPSVNYANTNAKIDLSKSFEEKYGRCFIIHSCNFSNVDLSNNVLNVHSFISDSNFSNTNIVFPSDLGLLSIYYSDFSNNDLSQLVFDGNISIIDTDIFEDVNFSNTGAHINLNYDDLRKVIKEEDKHKALINPTKERLKKALEEYWVGCYVNGKLIKSPDEKKQSAKATREEYEQYKSQEFANILGSIAEQMDSSGPKK